MLIKKKKAQVFQKEEFDTFVGNLDLTTPYWMVRKAVMVVAYFGGLRHTEADSLNVENFVETTEGIIVTHSRAKVSHFILFDIIYLHIFIFSNALIKGKQDSSSQVIQLGLIMPIMPRL